MKRDEPFCIEPLWIEQAKSGDPEAFACLFHRHNPSLLAYFHRHGCSPADAEDLLQETFLRTYLQLPRFKGESLRSFLYKIAHDLIADFFRAEAKRGPNAGLPVDTRAATVSAEPAESQLIFHELESFMDRIFLPIEKSVFLAAYRGGFTQRELTEKFGLPNTTINNWIARRDLIKRLVKELGARGGAPREHPAQGGRTLGDLTGENFFAHNERTWWFATV